ncbi:hypothetical protein HDU96_002929, partial [Phlyctochytrium bullatum]
MTDPPRTGTLSQLPLELLGIIVEHLHPHAFFMLRRASRHFFATHAHLATHLSFASRQVHLAVATGTAGTVRWDQCGVVYVAALFGAMGFTAATAGVADARVVREA